MKLVILSLLLCFSVQSFAQEYIGDKPSEIMEKRLKQVPATEFSKTDSTLSFTDSQTDTRFIYDFNTAGICDMEIVTTTCKSCYEKRMDSILHEKKYRWKKINGNQYVSKFRKKLLLETEPDPNRKSYRVIKTSWTRKTYRMLGS